MSLQVIVDKTIPTPVSIRKADGKRIILASSFALGVPGRYRTTTIEKPIL
jgi:hypothetical protein